MEKLKQHKVDREKFKQGCIAIFRRWTAFRMTLDRNPQILRYITDNNTIEINDFLEILYDDIINTIKSNKSGMKELTDNVADCLNYFIGDYFKVQLADDSDLEIAQDLIKLYDELKWGKVTFLNELIEKADKDNKQKYWIEFPITGKQNLENIPKKKKEESDSDEEDEEEEDEKDEKKNNNKDKKNGDDGDDNKMKIDEPDDDGFILIKKGKKGF